MNISAKSTVVLFCIVVSFFFGFMIGKGKYVHSPDFDGDKLLSNETATTDKAGTRFGFKQNSALDTVFGRSKSLDRRCHPWPGTTPEDTSTYRNNMDAGGTVVEAAQLDKIVRDLSSDQTGKKIKAINALSALGSPVIQNYIHALIIDPEQDGDTKAAAIKATRWNDDPDGLLNVFQGASDTEVLVAVIEAADDLRHDPSASSKFDTPFLDAYQTIDNAEMRIAILDYFINKPRILNQLVALNIPSLSSGVLKHIAEIQNDMEADADEQ